MLANSAHLWLQCFGWTTFPLPNPLPEGRGDRSERSGFPESAGKHGSFRLKPFLISARTAPSPFRAGRAAEGWGEGAVVKPMQRSGRFTPFASKLAPTKSGTATRRTSGCGSSSPLLCDGLPLGRPPPPTPPAA